MLLREHSLRHRLVFSCCPLTHVGCSCFGLELCGAQQSLGLGVINYYTIDYCSLISWRIVKGVIITHHWPLG
ncbi:hypothetical protein CR513_05699, partial [Mucuna pruriens]